MPDTVPTPASRVPLFRREAGCLSLLVGAPGGPEWTVLVEESPVDRVFVERGEVVPGLFCRRARLTKDLEEDQESDVLSAAVPRAGG